MFGSSTRADDAEFDEPGTFVPAHLPEPGPFLADCEVLTGDAHVQFHATTRELFEERGVYDVTFGYNLAELNRDRRHPNAGYRYGRESEAVLRAEFTPTTEFCPQGETLARASFRAWNGLAERHEYDLVRVRVCPTHQSSDRIDAELADLEETYRETGSLPGSEAGPDGSDGSGDAPTSPF
jgi:hypothetical protein